jgi:hypothetical protein
MPILGGGDSAQKMKTPFSISVALQTQMRPFNDPKTSLSINQNDCTNKKRSKTDSRARNVQFCDLGEFVQTQLDLRLKINQAK